MARIFHRTEPWVDAEMYAYDDRPVMGECEICGCEIHGQSRDYYADDAYLFDGGEFVCSDCVTKYCDEHFRI